MSVEPGVRPRPRSAHLQIYLSTTTVMLIVHRVIGADPGARTVLLAWSLCQCACCTTSCPGHWWNGDRHFGPAAVLQGCRLLIGQCPGFLSSSCVRSSRRAPPDGITGPIVPAR